MSRRKSSIDPCDYITVVCCPRCSWRSVAANPTRGWVALARHLATAHDDVAACKAALKNARDLQNSAKSPLEA